jgi:hypothetical protein
LLERGPEEADRLDVRGVPAFDQEFAAADHLELVVVERLQGGLASLLRHTEGAALPRDVAGLDAVGVQRVDEEHHRALVMVKFDRRLVADHLREHPGELCRAHASPLK